MPVIKNARVLRDERGRTIGVVEKTPHRLKLIGRCPPQGRRRRPPPGGDVHLRQSDRENNGVMFKGDRCYDRLARGESPACIEACPEGLQIIGPRDEIIARACTIAAEIKGYLTRTIHYNGRRAAVDADGLWPDWIFCC